MCAASSHRERPATRQPAQHRAAAGGTARAESGSGHIEEPGRAEPAGRPPATLHPSDRWVPRPRLRMFYVCTCCHSARVNGPDNTLQVAPLLCLSVCHDPKQIGARSGSRPLLWPITKKLVGRLQVPLHRLASTCATFLIPLPRPPPSLALPSEPSTPGLWKTPL